MQASQGVAAAGSAAAGEPGVQRRAAGLLAQLHQRGGYGGQHPKYPSPQVERLLEVSVSRNCPYKKFYLCVLPPYNTQDREPYLQQFEHMMQEVVDSTPDLTLQLTHTF